MFRFFSFLITILSLTMCPLISHASDKEKDAISRAWSIQWDVLLENEPAIANIRKLGILQAKCLMGKQVYTDKSELERNCQEYKAQMVEVETEALIRRYKSLQTLKILKNMRDDRVSPFLRDVLKKQIDELESGSPMKQFHPKEWQELSEKVEAEFSSRRKNDANNKN